MAGEKNDDTKVGRDAKSGKFISVKEAEKRESTPVVG